MNILVVGNGGREHAICWRLAQSVSVEKIFVVPGNGGTAHEKKCVNVPAGDYAEVARRERCTLAVIGPENPLADGAADMLRGAGIACVGPSQAAAALEASKDFAKSFMKKYGVASPASETFTDEAAALAYVKRRGAPIVVKADGLAAGKGVVVAKTLDEAASAVTDMMSAGCVGAAGKKIVIEEYLTGTEMSVLAAVSVTPTAAHPIIVPFLPARDHKRLCDGAAGPNTGGMGAVCPLTDVPDSVMRRFSETIVAPTLAGLIAEKFDYRGFIFFGVMNTPHGPKLLEYNVRLGDPETQAVLPLMDFDFAALCRAIADGTLSDFPLAWKSGYSVAPCVVSAGYPGNYETGKPISIAAEKLRASGAKIFIAGASDDAGVLKTSGGRVLTCSAQGETFDEARKRAYDAVAAVRFDGAFYRTDIGLPGAAEST